MVANCDTVLFDCVAHRRDACTPVELQTVKGMLQHIVAFAS